MQVTGTKRMGDVNVTFTAEGKDAKEALFNLAFLMDKDEVWIKERPLHEKFVSRPVWYEVRKTDDDLVYVKRKSRSADGLIASSTLGTYKKGGYFWHKWEVFDPIKNEVIYPPKEEKNDDF